MVTASVLGIVLAMASTQDPDPKKGKTLSFSDEFAQAGLPDGKKWRYEFGKLRNKEEQFYTRERTENARIEDGNLVIEARKEPWEGATVTSAALESNETWRYGYFEVRAKIPTGRGTWPAIWFLGESLRLKGADRRGWPGCGEIDLMENVGFDPDKLHFSIHTQKYNHMKGTQKTTVITAPKVWEEYHTYGLDWRADAMDFYFDGKKVMTYANEGTGEDAWPYDKPQFLILNLAIGGTWGGSKGVDDAILPCRMLVDYVRVYR